MNPAYSNIEAFDYNTEAWVGEAISKGVKRGKNAKCFNCGRTGHLRRIVEKAFLEIMSPLGMTKIEGLNLLDYVEDVAKADIGPMNVDQQKIDKATRYHWEMLCGAS